MAGLTGRVVAGLGSVGMARERDGKGAESITKKLRMSAGTARRAGVSQNELDQL
jgi:hypothetical protein